MHFKLIQYSAKVLVPLLHLRARLRHRVGLSKEATSSAAGGLSKLASVIGDARTLFGIWGMSEHNSSLGRVDDFSQVFSLSSNGSYPWSAIDPRHAGC
jgi:hypothetical protein